MVLYIFVFYVLQMVYQKYLYCDYNKIWSFLKDNYNDDSTEIKELLKKWFKNDSKFTNHIPSTRMVCLLFQLNDETKISTNYTIKCDTLDNYRYLNDKSNMIVIQRFYKQNIYRYLKEKTEMIIIKCYHEYRRFKKNGFLTN